MQPKTLQRLRSLHVRLDHDVRAEMARRVPDTARLKLLKVLKLKVKDRLAGISRGPVFAT